jgi:hypothetical protein
VCGHIHTAEMRDFTFDGERIEYWNDGDWVEGCNALVEHEDGRMEILDWPEIVAAREAAEEEARLAANASREDKDGEPDPQTRPDREAA